MKYFGRILNYATQAVMGIIIFFSVAKFLSVTTLSWYEIILIPIGILALLGLLMVLWVWIYLTIRDWGK